MNRRWDDTAIRAWLRDPWNQTHLIVLGVILPVIATVVYWGAV